MWSTPWSSNATPNWSVVTQLSLVADRSSAPGFPANWYPDPWAVAPWRWWDGTQWTPVVYGPYGEAWPTPVSLTPPFVPKGPGIKGGGVAAVGAGVGLVGTLAVAIVFAVATRGQIDVNDPWYLLASQLALWVGFVGAVVVASRMNGTGSLAADYGLSWPRIKDLWLGLGGAVVGRILPLVVLICIVLAGSGFGAPNAAAPNILGVTPSGIAGWVVVVLLAVVGAPIVEELFFRGLLQGAFTRRIGAVPASLSRRSSSASPTCSTRAHWPLSCSSPWHWSWGTSGTEPAGSPRAWPPTPSSTRSFSCCSWCRPSADGPLVPVLHRLDRVITEVWSRIKCLPRRAYGSDQQFDGAFNWSVPRDDVTQEACGSGPPRGAGRRRRRRRWSGRRSLGGLPARISWNWGRAETR